MHVAELKDSATGACGSVRCGSERVHRSPTKVQRGAFVHDAYVGFTQSSSPISTFMWDQNCRLKRRDDLETLPTGVFGHRDGRKFFLMPLCSTDRGSPSSPNSSLSSKGYSETEGQVHSAAATSIVPSEYVRTSPADRVAAVHRVSPLASVVYSHVASDSAPVVVGAFLNCSATGDASASSAAHESAHAQQATLDDLKAFAAVCVEEEVAEAPARSRAASQRKRRDARGAKRRRTGPENQHRSAYRSSRAKSRLPSDVQGPVQCSGTPRRASVQMRPGQSRHRGSKVSSNAPRIGARKQKEAATVNRKRSASRSDVSSCAPDSLTLDTSAQTADERSGKNAMSEKSAAKRNRPAVMKNQNRPDRRAGERTGTSDPPQRSAAGNRNGNPVRFGSEQRKFLRNVYNKLARQVGNPMVYFSREQVQDIAEQARLSSAQVAQYYVNHRRHLNRFGIDKPWLSDTISYRALADMCSRAREGTADRTEGAESHSKHMGTEVSRVHSDSAGEKNGVSQRSAIGFRNKRVAALPADFVDADVDEM